MTNEPPPTEFKGNDIDAGVRLPWKEDAAAWIGDHPERVAAALQRYFYRNDHQPRIFQGQHFEWFIARSDPNRFTAEDLAAIGALSVELPAQSARELLDDIDGTFTQLILECRSQKDGDGHPLSDLDLRTCPVEWLTDGDAPLQRLYRAVDDLTKVGSVKTSKLLAAKFPAIIPIRDRRVEQLLNLQKQNRWWVPIRELVSDERVHETLSSIRLPGDAPEVTVLRRLDVVLWMEARVRGIG